MNKERQLGKDFGILYGALSHNMNPSGVNVEDGFSSEYESEFRNANHSTIMKMAAVIISTYSQGDSHAVEHLNALASKSRNSSQHVKQASDLVFDTIKQHGCIYQKTGLVKSANLFLSALAAGGTGLAWLLGGGSALAGAGGGAMYNMTKREISEEEAENEARKRKIEYYKNLSEELNKKMDEKYEYS